MFNNQVIAGSSGQGGGFYDFPLEQSLRFNRADSAKLTRTASSPTLGTKATWSFWVKKCDVSEDTSSSYRTVFYCGTPNVDGLRIGFARYSGNNHVLHISQDNGSSSAYIFMRTEAALRDTSAWYNFVIRYDSTDATAADRIKVYINGELASIQSSPRTNPPLNHIPKWQVSGASLIIGDGYTGYNEAIDMYLAEVNFIDGQALDPTSFGEVKSGIWTPVDTSGLTFGSNGFRLQFGDTTEASGFNAVTYTGNAASSKAITGVGFSSAPDLVWIKERSSTSSHVLMDSVRGASEFLVSNSTQAEQTATTIHQSFDADGFTIGNSGAVNESGQTYVAWAWDAGSGSPASNTDGDITSTVKANTDYGFSITSYTGSGTNGDTVGHGLGVAPDMYIVKSRDNARDWRVYHSSLGATKAIQLNKTDAANTSSAFWNNTEPTSSVFTIGSVTTVNGSGEDYIAYCFAEKTGYSKFSSYTGTGAAGNSITGLGFKPAFVMFKRTDSTSDWFMLDNTRDTSNPIDKKLEANTSGAEVVNAAYETDFNSDGFVLQNTNAQLNASGGTYIYMAFADTRDAAFWRDTSGEGNDWQPNNLVFSDVVPDSTSNNWCVIRTMNDPEESGVARAEGNLKYTTGSGTSARNTNKIGISNILPSTGKWYAEARIHNTVTSFVGVGTLQGLISPTSNNTRYAYLYSTDGNSYVRTGASESISTHGAAVSVGDVVGIYVDMDAATPELYFSKNGQWANGSGSFNQSTPTSAITLGDTFFTADTSNKNEIAFHCCSAGSGTSAQFIWNFGQDSTFAGNEAAGGNTDANGLGDFFSTVPDNALALCTANLPSGAIDTLNDETPEDYFNTVLWTGDNTNNRSITGVGFQPSLVSAKSRSATSGFNWVDAVRGGTKNLQSNNTNAEATTNTVISFDSDGFTVGDGNGYDINKSGESIVGWSWKANGAGVSNTDGSITSTVSVGATSQQNWFSVVGFTTQAGGYTVGHGLGQKPSLIITKNRDTAGGAWYTFTDIIDGSVDYLALNQTSAKLNDPFGLANPTSSVFSLDDDYIFGSGDCIAYCFANAEGLCKVGSYVGNSSTDGTFVYTGFRPAFILIKKTTGTDDWLIHDNKRVDRGVDSNAIDDYLRPNLSNAEGDDGESVDFLSNGFKWRINSGLRNQSGQTYIYLAIAEQPFAFANAR